MGQPDPATPWTPYQGPWDEARAAHLLRRAGFDGNRRELQQALADGPRGAVDRLLAPPPGFDEFERRLDALAAPVAVSESAASDDSAVLWLYRMLQTPFPLLEKMALFWHGYFAVAGARVARVSLMERHVRLLRRHALGRFDALLTEICRDPATMAAFGARDSYKTRQPEQFAAAVLRFTVGEADVRDTARAFTGRFVRGEEVRESASEHDGGPKTILGRQGNFNAADVPPLLLRHPATARTVVRRLYRWLVSETEPPDEALLAPLATAFARDYDTGKLVGTMLRSQVFYSAYHQRVKSPVEFGVGIARAFEVPAAPAALHGQLAALGQRLLEPPTGQGWAGGRHWLNSFTMAARARLALQLTGKVLPPEFQLA